MTRFLKTTVLAAFLAVTGICASTGTAAPVQGQITFLGTYTLDGTDISDSTEFTSFTLSVFAPLTTGDFTGASGVSQVGFSFDPFPAGGVIPLWTLTTPDASFSLYTLTYGPTVVPGQTLFEGTGVIQMAGRDDTNATWSLLATDDGTVQVAFETTSSTGTAVPDGGATAALLGCSFIGLAYVRNRFALLKA